MNSAELKSKLADSDINVNRLACLIETTRQTASNKLNNVGTFTVVEAKKIADALHLTDEQIRTIFFDDEVY